MGKSPTLGFDTTTTPIRALFERIAVVTTRLPIMRKVGSFEATSHKKTTAILDSFITNKLLSAAITATSLFARFLYYLSTEQDILYQHKYNTTLD